MGKLTAVQVRNAKPGRHVDGQGLILLVRPGGSRSWVLRVQSNGKRRDYGLGSTLTLNEAREKAAAWRKAAKSGFDPSVEARRERKEIPTFEAVARQHHQEQKQGWKNGKHTTQWLTTLETYAFPVLATTPVDRIDASDMWTVLGPIWQEKPETARRVRQRMGTVLDFAKAKNWRETEAPMRALAKISSRQLKKAGNFAALPYAEIPALITRLRASEQSMGRLALQFTILNASRSGEVRAATWGEIDLKKGEWTIPADKMKGGLPHVVPLSESSIAILNHLRGFLDHAPGDVIFPGVKGLPLSDATLAKAFKGAGGEGYTVHGTARSGFRDWVAEQCPTVPGDVAEAALAHKVKDETEGAYRRATYLEQRRMLTQAWADYLSGNSNAFRLVAAS